MRRSVSPDAALDLQLELIESWRSPAGGWAVEYFYDRWALGGGSLKPPASSVQAEQAELLNQAETYIVDREFVGFVEGAADKLGETSPILFDVDLLTKSGFVLFEEPLMVADVDGGFVPIRAFSWAISRVHRELVDENDERMRLESDGVVITLLKDLNRRDAALERWAGFREELSGRDLPDEVADEAAQVQERADQLESVSAEFVAAARAAGWRSSVWPSDMTAWAFGVEWREITEEEIEAGVKTRSDLAHPAAADMRRKLYAFWHLIGQYVSVKQASRSARRRWHHRISGSPDFGDVRVVTLRRSVAILEAGGEGGGFGDGDGRDWSHRWVVRGHWRRQWYPSEGAHRVIWIDPFVKGPEDRPLIVKDRVFEVTR